MSPKKKIYCAGPLFNPKEREEMEELAVALENAGYEVFLPHRDGVELARIGERLSIDGTEPELINRVLSRAIFAIDAYHIANSDGMVVNLNGRVPDEGAMVEAGMAWAQRKPVVLYKNDSRTLILGADNPLVLGLGSFEIATTAAQVRIAFDRCFANGYRRSEIDLTDPALKPLKQGKQLQRILRERPVNRLNAVRLGKVLK